MLLRIDFFEYKGKLIVNEVEGFEAQTQGLDSIRLDALLEKWWFDQLYMGIDFILHERGLIL